MLVNKKKDMTPFDMKRRPAKQYPFLLPIIWGGSYIMTRQFKLKINKINMKKIKPPYLVISTHQGFSDYYIGPLAMFPRRAMYVSDMEGFAAFGKWLYRGIGCIGKRRYVPDTTVISNMKYAFSKGQSVMLFPESRHSNVGTTAYIPDNIGRLAKYFGVPVVTLSVNGSYLANPFWQEEKTHKVPIKVQMECIYDADTLKNTSADDIQTKIEEKLTYDEYDYQHKTGFLIKEKDRAEGLEKALYQCKACGKPYHMTTRGATLTCESCNESWILSEDGWLVDDKQKKIHIPDWYKWQRANVIDTLRKEPQFTQTFNVTVEALPNEKGFIPLGDGTLTLDETLFVLDFTDINGNKQKLISKHEQRESVQTEYNYRKKGPCIVLSDKDCCYYLYPKSKSFQPTELQFIGEYLYQKYKKQKAKKQNKFT